MLNKEGFIMFESVASIDVDPLKTFTPLCPDELPIPGGDEIGDELNAQAKYASLRVLIKETHTLNAIWIDNDPEKMMAPLSEPNADKKWPAHAIIGTKGWELLDELDEKDYQLIVYKGVESDLHPYGGCYHTYDRKISTGVIETLIANDIKTVIFGGLAMDVCLLQTIIEVNDKNKFNIIVNLAATRAITPSGYDEALKTLKSLKTDKEVFIVNDSSEIENILNGGLL